MLAVGFGLVAMLVAMLVVGSGLVAMLVVGFGLVAISLGSRPSLPRMLPILGERVWYGPARALDNQSCDTVINHVIS